MSKYTKTPRIRRTEFEVLQGYEKHPEDVNGESGKIEVVTARAKRDLSKENLEFFESFSEKLILDNISVNGQLTNLTLFMRLSQLANCDWKDVDESKLKTMVAEIMKQYSKKGKETGYTRLLKITLKSIIRLIHTGSRNLIKHKPELEMLQFMTINKPKSNLTREDLPTQKEIDKLLAVCADSSRDKALIAVHSEAGTRIAEALHCKIKDFVIMKHGGYLKVDGKTGTRSILILKSVHYLTKWLNEHPDKDNREAPMFVYLHKKNTFGKRMNYHGFYQMLQRRVKQAGITKRMYSHLFRHAAVTKLSGKITESESRMRHGWQPNSTMPSAYAHLNQEDLDSKILETYGIKPTEVPQEEFKECVYCKISYPLEVKYCDTCSKPLDINDALEMEREVEEKNKAMMFEMLRKEKAAESKGRRGKQLEQQVDEQQKELKMLREMVTKLSKAE